LFPVRLTSCLVGLVLGQGAKVSPEAFADRWVASTQSGDRRQIESLFVEKGKLFFESAGRTREVDLPHYIDLLAATLPGFKSFRRERGEVELVAAGEGAEEAGKGPVLWFTITDRIQTPEGFTLQAVNREEFELAPGEVPLAVRYRSRTLSCESLEKPEGWMNYGGPGGLNGFLIESHFQAPPEGMGVVILGMAVALLLFLKILYSLGLGMKRGRVSALP
jgi:hypothetical protein